MRKVRPEVEVAFLWHEDTAKKYGEHAYLTMLDQLKTNIFHPHSEQVDQEMMDKCKEASLLVYPWVSMAGEQEPEKLWTKLYGLGVDGLCTNLPGELSMWLKQK